MSRFLIFIFCLTLSFGAASQTKVVKDVEHILNSAKPNYEDALKQIKPALTNEESKDNVQAWIYAGKAAIGTWDKMMLNIQLGQDVNGDAKKKAAHNLIDSYTYLMTALPLDSLPNSKGKVKPSNSKNIRKLLAKNYRAFRNAGIFLYDLKDYQGAYDAWEIYTNLPDRLNAQHKILKKDPDSDLGQIYYYQAISAQSLKRYDDALESFSKAISTGFSNKNLYIYGMEAARKVNNDSLLLAYARTGAQLYGKQDVSFNLVLINDRLNAADYNECRRLVTEALKIKSDDNVKSQLYDVMGVICEESGQIEDAITNFQKSVVFNENYAKGYFDLARIIYNESSRLANSDDEETLKQADKGLKKAAEYFEKAYSLDESLTQIPTILYTLYYRLGIGYEAKTDYWQQKQKK